MNTKTEYLTIREAAELLGVTPATLRNWDKSKKLVAHRDPVNGYRLYALEDVTKILRDRGESDPPNVQTSLSSDLFSESESKQDIRPLRSLVRQMSETFRNSIEGGAIERFEEISKLLFCKLYDEQHARTQENYRPQFSFSADASVDETYQRLESLYEEAISLLPEVFTDSRRKLSTDKRAVVRIAELLHPVSLSDIPADIRGRVYEELIQNTFERSDTPQFLTPRPIAEFMVRFIQPQSGQTFCDPACGSGGVLLEVSKHIERVLRSQGEGETPTNRVAEYLSDHIIGLELNTGAAWVAAMNLMLHGYGHGNIYPLDGNGSLGFSEDLDRLVKPDGFDIILTHPPFGSHLSDEADLSSYQLGEGKSSRRSEVLFIERCISWLKPGGRLGIIIVDSVLNVAANADVRDLVLQHCVVEAVMSLPNGAFMQYSGVKTSILFLRKKRDNKAVQSDVFMVDMEHIGQKHNRAPFSIRHEGKDRDADLLSDFAEVVKAWQIYTMSGAEAITHLSPKIFVCPSERFTTGSGVRFDVQFHHPSRTTTENALNRSVYPTPKLAELIVVRNEKVIPSKHDPDVRWHYVRFKDIAAGTNEYAVSHVLGSELKRNVRRFHPKDILFSKLQPELRKCVLVREGEDEGYVSSECLVLRTVEDALEDPFLRDIAADRKRHQLYQVDREYLTFILRSDIVFGQLVYQTTGTVLPGVNSTAVLGLRIPVPPLSVQREIVGTYKTAWDYHLECRVRSETALQSGKEVLEAAYHHASHRLCPMPKEIT